MIHGLKRKRGLFKVLKISVSVVALTLLSMMAVYAEGESNNSSSENNRLLNGSFEDIQFTLNTSYAQINQDLVDYWNTTATDGKIELLKKNHNTYIKQVTVTPPDPKDGTGLAAELNADEESTLYQVVKTSPSSIYEWGLTHGARNGTDTMALVIGPDQTNKPAKPNKQGRDQFMQMVDWLISKGLTSIKTKPTIDKEIVMYSKKFGENGTFLNNDDNNAFSLTHSTVYTEEWHIWVMASSSVQSGENPWYNYGSNAANEVGTVSGSTVNVEPGVDLSGYYYYTVPAGQTRTMFSFVSVGVDKPSITDVTKQKTYGNFLDNIKFKIYHPLSGSCTSHGTSIIGGSDGGVTEEGGTDDGYRLTVGDKLVTYINDGQTLRLQALVTAKDFADGCEFVGLYYTKQDENGNPRSIFLQKSGNVIEYDPSLTEDDIAGKWVRRVEENGNVTYTYYLEKLNSATDLHFVFIKNPTVTYDSNGGKPYVVDREFNTGEDPNVYSFKPSDTYDAEFDSPTTFINPYKAHAAEGKTDDWKFTGWLLTGDIVSLGESAGSVDLVNADKVGSLILPANHTIACNYSTRGAGASLSSQYFKIVDSETTLTKDVVKSSTDEVLGCKFSDDGTRPRLYSNVHNGITMVAQWRWRQRFIPQFKGVHDPDYTESIQGGTVEFIGADAEYLEDLGTKKDYFARLDESVKVRAVTNPGYLFEGWYDKDGKLLSTNSEYGYTETLEGVTTIYARFSGSLRQEFERQVFDETDWVKVDDDTIATLDKYEYEDSPGTLASCTVTEGTGYKLVGWFDTDGNAVDSSMISNGGRTISYNTVTNAKYIARFERAYIVNFKTQTKYTETDIRNDSLGGTVSIPSFKGFDGETGSCKAAAKSNHSFIGWFDEDGNKVASGAVFNPVISPSENGKTYYARFEKHYRISFVAHTEQEDGTFGVTGVEGTVSLTTKSAKDNTEANSTASVPEGSKERFIGWFDADGNKLTDDVTLERVTSQGTDGKTFYARFTKYVEQDFIRQVKSETDDTWVEETSVVESAADISLEHHRGKIGTDVSSTVTTKNGYKFLGWFNEAGIKVGDNEELSYTTTKTEKYYARFEKLYTVTFKAQLKQSDGSFADSTLGGTVSHGTFTDVKGTMISSLAAPKSNMVFLGWFNSEGTKLTEAALLSEVINGNTEYFARFEDKVYNVIFKPQLEVGGVWTESTVGGTVSLGSGSGIIGTNISSVANENTEYDFLGWFKGDTKVGDNKALDIVLSSDVNENVYYARFRVKTYKIEFKTQLKELDGTVIESGIGGNITNTEAIGVKGTVAESIASANEHYRFLGWYDEHGNVVSTELRYSTSLSSDIHEDVYYARFENIKYNVNFVAQTKPYGSSTFVDSTEGGTVSRTSHSGISSEQFNSKATNKSEYEFLGWFDESGNLVESGTDISKNFGPDVDSKTFYARFVPIEYTVRFEAHTKQTDGTFRKDGALVGGTVNISSGAGIKDTLVESTATVNAKYEFLGWYLGDTKVSDELAYQVNLSSDVNNRVYVARFERVYTVNFEAWTKQTDGTFVSDITGGTVTKNSDSGKVGDNVTVSAVANEEYKFLGWFKFDGTKVTDNKDLTVDFGMDTDNETYHARFEVKTYNVNFKAQTKNPVTGDFEDSSLGGNVSNLSGSGVKGTVISSTASEAEDYVFIGWYNEDGTPVTSNKTCEISLESGVNNKVYCARFDKASYIISFEAQTKNSLGVYEPSTLGGTISEITGTGNRNDIVTSVASVNTGYVFKGWYEEGNDTVIETDSTLSITLSSSVNNKKYIARFEAVKYNVQFIPQTKNELGVITDGDNTGGNVSVGNGTGHINETVKSKATPNNKYKFTGWYDESGNLIDTGAELEITFGPSTDGRKYYARFEAIKYTVAFKAQTKQDGVDFVDSEDGGFVTVSNASAMEDAVISSTASSREGYKFVGWFNSDGTSVQSGETLSITIRPEDNGKVYLARFEKLYTVKFEAQTKKIGETSFSTSEDGGTVSTKLVTEVAGFNTGSIANVKNGYKFMGWYDESGNLIESDTNLSIEVSHLTNNKVYFARFEETVEQTFVRQLKNGDSWVAADDSVAVLSTYTHRDVSGVNVSSTVTVQDGYTFLGWYNSDGSAVDNALLSGDGKTISYVTSDNKTYIARFEVTRVFVDQTFIRQVEDTSGNWVDTNDDSVGTLSNYNHHGELGDIAESKATEGSGYEFAGWFNSDGTPVNSNILVDGGKTIKFNTSGNITFYARFRLIPVPVNVTQNFYRQVLEGENFVNTTDDSVAVLTNYTHTDVIGSTVESTAVAGSGYEFKGWYDSAGNLVTSGETLRYTTTGDAEYFARFAPEVVNYYTQKFIRQIDNGSGWEEILSDDIAVLTLYNHYDVEGSSVESKAVAKEGYTFLGWYDSTGNKLNDGDPRLKDAVTISYDTVGDATYYARFERIIVYVDQTFIRQVKNGENWEVTTDDNIGTLNTYSHHGEPGENVSSTASVGAGYKFVGWFNEDGSEVDSSLLIDSGRTIKYTTSADVTYIARFSLITYEVNFIAQTKQNDGTFMDDATGGNVSISRAEAVNGDAVISVAQANTGYQFIGWYDLGGNKLIDDENFVVTLSASMDGTKYYARFEKLYTVNFVAQTKQSDGSFINDSVGGTVTVDSHTGFIGSTVTSKAVTNTGYKFLGWYDEAGNLLGNDVDYSTSTGVDTDGKTYYARFELITYTVRFEAQTKQESTGDFVSDNIGGRVTFDFVTGPAGTVAVSQAVANSGFRFLGWFKADGTKLTENVQYSVNIEESINGTVYYARFEKVVVPETPNVPNKPSKPSEVDTNKPIEIVHPEDVIKDNGVLIATPKPTGDKSQVWLYAGLMLISILGIITNIILHKKSRD